MIDWQSMYEYVFVYCTMYTNLCGNDVDPTSGPARLLSAVNAGGCSCRRCCAPACKLYRNALRGGEQHRLRVPSDTHWFSQSEWRRTGGQQCRGSRDGTERFVGAAAGEHMCGHVALRNRERFAKLRARWKEPLL